MNKRSVEFQLKILQKIEEELLENLRMNLQRQNECKELLSFSFSGDIDSSSMSDQGDGIVRSGLSGGKKLDDG